MILVFIAIALLITFYYLNESLNQIGDMIMATIADVAAKVDAVVAAVGRAELELRDLASKITPSTDPAALEDIASRLNVVADGLNAVVTEVDNDGSSPQV